MTLKLNNPIWDSAKRRAVISKVVFETGVDFGADVRENMKRSVPRGKIYRRGSITRTATKKNAVKGLRMTTSGKRIVGAKIHRASAKGQPPAIDTAKLYNSIAVQRVSEFRVRVAVNAEYAKFLEPPARLDRPFFHTVFQKNRTKYTDKVNRAVRGLYKGI